jgi:hypothetical protein
MLRDDINNAVKDAMRAKDERKLSTLRMVNSTIKNADIAARGEGKPPLSDADLLGVFQKMIKQRQDPSSSTTRAAAPNSPMRREEIAIISAICRSRCRTTTSRRRAGAMPRPSGRDEGHGQGDRGAEGEIRRPDGFRQSQRPGEGGAGGVSLYREAKTLNVGGLAPGIHVL